MVSVRPKPEDISTVAGRRELLSYQGSLIPIYHINRTFSVDGAIQDPTEAVIVIVEDEGQRIGLVADEILGQQQIVIKTLGEYLGEVPGIAGGAIMPDGKVGLIIDINGLVKLSKEEPAPALSTFSTSSGNGQAETVALEEAVEPEDATTAIEH